MLHQKKTCLINRVSRAGIVLWCVHAVAHISETIVKIMSNKHKVYECTGEFHFRKILYQMRQIHIFAPRKRYHLRQLLYQHLRQYPFYVRRLCNVISFYI